jgi:hypothetical protein
VIKRNSLFLCLFIFFDCTAQLINPKPVDIPLGPINFNAEYIKANKVKSIVLDIVDKPDGSVIIDKDATQGYEFDAMGRLTRYYYTILRKTTSVETVIPAIKKKGKVIREESVTTTTQFLNDTIFANVFYDANSRVILKRVRTGDFYIAFYYEYDEKQQLKKEIHFKETNINENKKEFTLGVQTQLSSETFQYTALTPTQIKKTCLNDEGREYKKAIINYDPRGNKISESYEFIVSWMRLESSYKYDSNNRLIDRVIRTNDNGEQKAHSIFTYNDKNLLLSEQKFKEGEVLLNEISYLYDASNTLIKSQINRDFKNASIGITKYSYTFY